MSLELALKNDLIPTEHLGFVQPDIWVTNASGVYYWEIVKLFDNGSAFFFISLSFNGTLRYDVGRTMVQKYVSLDLNSTVLINGDSSEAYIDGIKLGKVPYWIPVDVKAKDKVNLVGFDEVMATIEEFGRNPVETPLGYVNVWVLIFSGEFHGERIPINNFYAKVTGILIGAITGYVDPILYHMGVSRL